MFCGNVLGKLLHTVRQVLTEEELNENIGDISKKVWHNFPSKWALSVQSPQNLTKLLHLRSCDTRQRKSRSKTEFCELVSSGVYAG